MNDFECIVNGAHLTTVEIIYRLPDYPEVLQTYLWQEYDYPPSFPKLKDFLLFWEDNIEGKLYTINVAFKEDVVSQNFLVSRFLEKLN